MKRGIVGVAHSLLTACALITGALSARAADGQRAPGNEVTALEQRGPVDNDGPKVVTVDAAGQARFGVAVITLKAATAPAADSTAARVLDPGPLLELDSEVAAASASLAASRAEAERTRKLFAQDRTASARAVEAANAQEQADMQRVTGPQRRLAIEWGPGVVDLPAKRRAALLNDLAHSRAALVRVEMPVGTAVPKPGTGIQVRGSADSAALAGIVLGVLPLGDPRLQTRGVLVELKDGAANLPIGQMLVADLPATAKAGVILPRSALLRRDSRVWVYVQTSPTTFMRREVKGYRPDTSGWLVADGFAPGDRVVAAGAAALLGVESPAPADADSDAEGT